MSSRWDDLVARVRGLSCHLLGRSRLAALAHARDLVQLGAALEGAYGPGYGIGESTSPAQLELAVRRVAARYLRIIARWARDRAKLMAPLFLDEDRRSIRALLRGAAAGTPASERLAALVPTPALPERALEELARQTSISDVVALLVLWGHPLGAPLLSEARRPQPDLLRIDLELNSAFAKQATRAVRGAPLGNSARRDLRTWVHTTIDLENAFTAVQLAAPRTSLDPARLFVPGGHLLDRAGYTAAAAAGSGPAAVALLQRTLRDSAMASVFTPLSTESLEDAALAAELRRTTAAARRSPLGTAPLISFLTRLRAEGRDVRFIIWRAALGAPPASPETLVTVV